MKHLRVLPMLALVAFAVTTASAVPVLVNGSLTGPIANSTPPPGWGTVSGSPDTMDQNSSLGVPGLMGFTAVPSGSSPDGGTWVAMARTVYGYNESFGQLVTGFDVGATYQLSWYQGNFGYSGYDTPNSVEILLNGVSVGMGSIVPASPNWTSDSVTFVATSPSLQIDIQLSSPVDSYMSIDGLSLTSSRRPPQVPDGGSTLVLLGIAVAGLGFYRHRRA